MKSVILSILLFLPVLFHGQITDSTVQKLIRLKLIESSQRDEVQKVLNWDAEASNALNVLLALNHMEQKKLAGNSVNNTITYFSFKHQPTETEQTEINKKLHELLSKLKEGNYITPQIKQEYDTIINKNKYVHKIQLLYQVMNQVKHENRMQPEKLILYANDLYQHKILDAQRFEQLKTDIQNGKIKESYQFIPYCQNSKFFNLSQYPDPPSDYLKKIHTEVSQILPELNFTNFHYTIELDSLNSFPDYKSYDVVTSITIDGREYQHKSFIDTVRKDTTDQQMAKFGVHEFYQIFNKVLSETQSSYRLHVIEPSQKSERDFFDQGFGIIALQEEQTEMFESWAFRGYLKITKENFENLLTREQINEGVKIYKETGILNHLSDDQIKAAIDKALQGNYMTMHDILSSFPSVIYSFNSVQLANIEQPYGEFLKVFTDISHRVFNPIEIHENFDMTMKTASILRFKFKGKQYTRKMKVADDYLDETFIEWINSILKKNQINGKFYNFDADAGQSGVIFLTKGQEEQLRVKKLLMFEEEMDEED